MLPSIILVTTNAPLAVFSDAPWTMIGLPWTRPWGSPVSTTICELSVTVRIDVIGRSASPFLLKKVGMLLTSSRVSHLVDCRPYSKSVSIKLAGVDTRNLDTGSVYVSSGMKVFASASMNTCNVSVSDIDVVSNVKTSVVVSATVLILYAFKPSACWLKT